MSWQARVVRAARRRARRRLRLVRARAAARARARAGGGAGRARRRRAAGVRRDPERQADHRHRPVRRLRARRGAGLRGRRGHGARLEHLPLAGALDRLADGRLGRRRASRAPCSRARCAAASRTGSLLAAVCGLAGLAFGAWMDVYQWTLAARQDLDYLPGCGRPPRCRTTSPTPSGNVVFCLLIGPAFLRALARYRRRFEVRWERRPRRWCSAALAVALVLLLPAAAVAATPAQRAARYLAKAQNNDGGFGAAPGAGSSPLYTGWAGLGLGVGRPEPARRAAAERPLAGALRARDARARSPTSARSSARCCSRTSAGPRRAQLRRARPGRRASRGGGATTARSPAS